MSEAAESEGARDEEIHQREAASYSTTASGPPPVLGQLVRSKHGAQLMQKAHSFSHTVINPSYRDQLAMLVEGMTQEQSDAQIREKAEKRVSDSTSQIPTTQ